MSRFELFGTLTSPYVRRVRIVAAELGVRTDWTDTSTPEGQAALRELNPIWKVPAARIEDQRVFDSALICRTLMARFGPGPLSSAETLNVDALNTILVIDGALDSLINAFYLAKDGVQAADVAYVQKQRERAVAALRWVEGRVRGPWLTEAEQFGLPEIALITALDWMAFRQAHDVGQHPLLVECASHHRHRPSVASTAPALR